METTKRKKQTTENFIKDVRRKTRRVFSSEQKIQIVMEAMRAELSVSEICRKYSIADAQFYKWNKEFLEAGKKRLAGDVTREATSDEEENSVKMDVAIPTELKAIYARIKKIESMAGIQMRMPFEYIMD